MQALKHVRQQGVEQLRGSRPEGSQQPQPLLRKSVCATLAFPCRARRVLDHVPLRLNPVSMNACACHHVTSALARQWGVMKGVL